MCISLIAHAGTVDESVNAKQLHQVPPLLSPPPSHTSSELEERMTVFIRSSSTRSLPSSPPPSHTSSELEERMTVLMRSSSTKSRGAEDSSSAMSLKPLIPTERCSAFSSFLRRGGAQGGA